MDIIGRWKKLALDTALLTGSSIILRCIAMAFQVWLVGRIGQTGIGLFQLIASVNMLCVTFAVSGIRFTTTRLVSEELGSGESGRVGRAMARCLGYALFFGTSALVVLLLCAEPIGFLWIGDARTVLSLRIIALRMPFVAVSSVLNGCFIASGRVYKAAAIQIAEQLACIGLVIWLLGLSPEGDLEKACAAVSLGGTGSDAFSMLLCLIVYLRDRRGSTKKGGCGGHLAARMFRIAVPLALSAYARTSLTTLEDLLVPRKLRASGLSADAALSGYGTITGMVFPIISFPACLLLALAELVVPDLTAAQVTGDTGYIRRTVSALLKTALVFSLVTSGFIFFTADALGALIYKTVGLGGYIRVFALLAPIMYMDIVIDGCLKGLGQMMRSMCYNIAEALLGVALVITVLPRWALHGYIAVLFVCEIFNFTLSMTRLKKVSGFSLFAAREPPKPERKTIYSAPRA
jgi:O-antigen/teichoic acid export membrane protein